jgi:SAM-dependent methyltransferase
MQADVIAQLKELNRQFYDEFATVFADSRGRTEPGLERILAQVQPGARVLDLGCGQGRVAALLSPGCAYVGVDFSAEMLALARREAQGLPQGSVRFVLADLLDPAWPAQVKKRDLTPLVPLSKFWRGGKAYPDAGLYNWILLRAVLHHVPAYDNRVAILTQAATLLAPDGRLAMANWQFLNIPRLRRRLLPWDTIGLMPTDVESGDYLLDWRREGHGLRYVHLVDEAETRSLAQDAGLQIQTLYRADGHTNDLTLYAIMA